MADLKKRLPIQFDIADLSDELPQVLRDAMLDVVLAWGSLDGAISQLYATLFGLEEVQNADAISDMRNSTKLRQIQLALRPQTPDGARIVGKLKKQFERYSQVRDTIAHCHCRGSLKSDANRVVFMRFRRHEDGLAVETMPLALLKDTARFGEHVRKAVLNLDGTLNERRTGHG